MPITLLLDLDDTLLHTDVAAFLPSYYDALARHLSGLVEPKSMLSALRSGVEQMRLNTDPTKSLETVFEADFYPRMDADRDELRRAIEGFYRDTFPTLKARTREVPRVREFIDWAFAAGHTVAVATDPLFPRAATFERVRWAGLDPDRFALISSFETFHFTKSHPAYLAEMLGRLGWPDQPALMAGDDAERDLQPAQRLGLAAFHVTGDGNSGSQRSGGLDELRAWIETREAEIPAPSITTREAILAVLESTPAVLQGMTTGLTAAEWSREPGPDEWAILELVCHLRDTEREVHAEQLGALIESEAPFIARPNAGVWAKQRRYLNEHGPTAIQEFAVARRAGLERLRAAPDEIWLKPARHAIFGPTHFLEAIGFMAEHDRLHLQQAWRTLQMESLDAHRN